MLACVLSRSEALCNKSFDACCNAVTSTFWLLVWIGCSCCSAALNKGVHGLQVYLMPYGSHPDLLQSARQPAVKTMWQQICPFCAKTWSSLAVLSQALLQNIAKVTVLTLSTIVRMGARSTCWVLHRFGFCLALQVIDDVPDRAWCLVALFAGLHSMMFLAKAAQSAVQTSLLFGICHGTAGNPSPLLSPPLTCVRAKMVEDTICLLSVAIQQISATMPQCLQ